MLVGDMNVMVNLRLQEVELGLIDPSLLKPYE